MPVAAIATVAAAAIGAGASMSAADKAAKATKSASKSAAATADKELAFQQKARDEARAIFTPYSREGAAARRMYNAAMGVAPAAATSTGAGVAGADTLDAARAAYNSGFEASPYWQDAQYATGQAMNALRSTNAALGRGSSINSGKALRAASDIQQGYRGQATQNYLTSLNGISDTGMTADSGIASGGQVYANNASNAIRNASQLQQQYTMAGAQAYGGAMSNLAGIAGWTAGQFNQPTNYLTAYQPAPTAAWNPTPLPALQSVSSYSPLVYNGGGN